MYYRQEPPKLTQEEKDRIAILERMHDVRLQIMMLTPIDGSPLSRRETEILREVATGKKGRQIAKELYIDMQTVKSHIKSIYRKLKVNLRADAIRVAQEERYI